MPKYKIFELFNCKTIITEVTHDSKMNVIKILTFMLQSENQITMQSLFGGNQG